MNNTIKETPDIATRYKKELKNVEINILIQQIRHFREAVDECICIIEREKNAIKKSQHQMDDIQKEIDARQAIIEKFEQISLHNDDLVDKCEDDKFKLEFEEG